MSGRGSAEESFSLAAPSPRLELGQRGLSGSLTRKGKREEIVQVRPFPWYRKKHECLGIEWKESMVRRSGDDGWKVMKENGKGWGGQINSGKRWCRMAWTKETTEVPQAQSAMTPKSSSKDRWGERGGRSRSHCGASPLWG